MKTLAIDIETYCELDLSKVGVYAYCDNKSFEILLFAYAFDDEEIKIVDLAKGEKLPEKVIDALFDEKIIKTAFNAAFERICISTYLGKKLSPKSWVCTCVQSAMLALPLSLEGVGKVLNIDNKKLKEGKDLIKFFCKPCKTSISNNNRKRNLPQDEPHKWELFKKYCIGDVKAESEIRHKLRKFPISHEELKIYEVDQEINDRGIFIDKDLVHHAIACHAKYKEKLCKRAYELTNIENINSTVQVKNWLKDHDVKVDTLDKKSVTKLINKYDGEIEEVLKIRLLTSKTSIKKYESIEKSLCRDDRVRGLLQFYGASRSGRWAGRLVQVQNLPQNHMVSLDLARSLLKAGRYEDIELLYDSTPEVLSELIRTAFIPRENCRFIVADFSAIEARVLAWIAKENWRLKVFASHGKIYEASAAAMFNVPINDISKDSILRQKGKIAELALGYGGSQGALTSMGAIDMGVAEDELPTLVNKWRKANPNIVKFWWEVDKAAITAVKKQREVSLGRISFNYRNEKLFITLPSGRKLSYIKPKLKINKFGREGLVYEGMGSNKKWTTIETYGPKLVENIVQAISRDLLSNSLVNLRNRGFDIVLHVHDEVVVEVPRGVSSVEEVCEIMTTAPKWADGLTLRAEGYECDYYKK